MNDYQIKPEISARLKPYYNSVCNNSVALKVKQIHNYSFIVYFVRTLSVIFCFLYPIFSVAFAVFDYKRFFIETNNILAEVEYLEESLLFTAVTIIPFLAIWIFDKGMGYGKSLLPEYSGLCGMISFAIYLPSSLLGHHFYSTPFFIVSIAGYCILRRGYTEPSYKDWEKDSFEIRSVFGKILNSADDPPSVNPPTSVLCVRRYLMHRVSRMYSISPADMVEMLPALCYICTFAYDSSNYIVLFDLLDKHYLGIDKDDYDYSDIYEYLEEDDLT